MCFASKASPSESRAGRTVPKGKQMGHAGAITSNGEDTAAEKIAAFEAADIEVAKPLP